MTLEQERTLADITPRLPVPSARELAAGVAMPDVSPLETLQQAAKGPRLSVRGRLTRFLRDSDPRDAVQGESLLPLVVFGLLGFSQAIAARTVDTNLLAIMRDLDLSVTTLGMIGASVGLVGNLCDIGFGYLADRVRRTLLGLVIGLVGGLSYLILGFWGTLAAFVVYRLVSGVFGGFGAGSAINQPLMSDYYPPEARGRVFSATAVLAATGGIVGPLIGGVLGNVFGWQTAIMIAAVPAILLAFGYLLLREPVRGRYDRLRLGATDTTAAVEHQPPGFSESFRAARAIGTLRRMWAAEIFLAIGGAAIVPVFIVTIADTYGGNALLFGLFLAAQQLSSVIGLSIGGTYADRLLGDRPGRVMVLVGLTQVVGIGIFVLMAFSPPAWLLAPIFILLPIATAVPQMAKAVLLSLVIPARLRGFGMQSINIFGLIGLVVVIPTMGVLAITDAGLSTIFLLGTPLLTVGALLYLTASNDVAKDIENARLAVLAEEEMAASRTGGKPKLLVCRKVDVHYDGVQVLFGVDFDVDEGELVALLGTNGAGKSTLLRAISGLSQPTGGAVFLDGRDVTHAPAHELAAFGVVQMPGGKGVFPALTVVDNLRTAAWLDSDDFEQRVQRVFELFPSLRGRRTALAGNLSGGEQQMVALGQALLMRPKILLIDELSLGLAPTIVEELLQALDAIRATGTTIILVEQSVNLALTIADRAVFMEKGEVRFSGPTAELMQRPDILRSVYLKGTGGAATRTRAPQAADRTTVLRADDVHVSYGGVVALRGATVDVGAGEIVGILGPNGAGKTTLFDAISGFAPLTAGSITVAGKDITALRPDERAKVGLGRSFQDARLFGSLTVLENILVAMERHAAASSSAALSALWLPAVRRAETRMRRRADGLIELLGLGAFRDKFVSELSTGSRRIVDLACVMATDPEVLLLDEPSSGIAQAEAEELGPLLDRVRRDVGCGLLVIEHDVRLLTGIADRLYAMVLGQTIASGPADEVLEHPTLVEAYLGNSERVLARSGEPVPVPPRSDS